MTKSNQTEPLNLSNGAKSVAPIDDDGLRTLRRGHWSKLSRVWRRGRDDDDEDDDDDPPPAPASIQPRLPALDGSLAAAA